MPENGTYPPTGNFIKENDNYPMGLGVLFPDKPDDVQTKEMEVGISVTTKNIIVSTGWYPLGYVCRFISSGGSKKVLQKSPIYRSL